MGVLREPFPTQKPEAPLRVVVLTCDGLGVEVANALTRASHVKVAGLVMAPYRTARRSFRKKLAHVYRFQGWPGLARAFGAKVWRGLGRDAHPAAPPPPLAAGIARIDVADFHDAATLTAIAALRPDLGIVAGTYVLRESVFGIPRFGSINLHSGKTPEYRGSAPAFWELFNGETSVGITIHRVESGLDAGDVILQRTFPLDAAPAGDPMDYIRQYRRDVLRPHGIQMMVEATESIAAGTASPRAQDHSVATLYRNPDHRAQQELKRRVRGRRLKTP